MTTIPLTSGTDTLTGAAFSDNFTGKVSDFQVGDTIQGGGNFDYISLTAATPGAITDATFQHVIDVESLQLSGKAATTVTLGANSDAAGLTQVMATTLTGALTLDASARGNSLQIGVGAGANTLTATGGDDTIYFSAPSLGSNDTIKGGAGTDQLFLSGKIAITDAAFAHITGIEQLELYGSPFFPNADLEKLTLGKLSVAAGVTEIDTLNNQGQIVLDASARTAGIELHGGNYDDVFKASQGNDTFLGGSGGDSYQVKAAQFDAQDHIDGGLLRDEIRIMDSGTPITDALFAGTHSVETLALNATGKQTVTLGAAASHAGIDTIDASKVTGGLTLTLDNGMTNPFTVLLGTGADTLNLGNGSTHTIAMKSTSLTAADHIHGNSNGFDTLKFTDAVKLTDKVFAGFSGVDHIGVLTLDSSAKGQTFTAGDNFKTFVAVDGLYEVQADSSEKTSSVTFDFSKYTGNTLLVAGGSGSDVFLAGTTNNVFLGASPGQDQGMGDSFRFHSADYTAADMVVGGKSLADELVILDAATKIVDTDFTLTSGVEALRLGATTTGSYDVTLGAHASAAGIMTVDGSKAGVNVHVDASDIHTDAIIGAGAKDNVLIGGDADDGFLVDPKTLNANDVIDGGLSNSGDSLWLMSGGTVTAAQLANVTNVELIELSDKGNTFIAGDNLPSHSEAVTRTFNGLSLQVQEIIVTGAGKDTVDLSQLHSQAGQVLVLGSAGDKYIGSYGQDIFVFQKPSDLTATTQIDGGSGGGALILAGGTYTAAQFKGVHNIDSIGLSDFNASADFSLTFDAADFKNLGNKLWVNAYGMKGDLTFDASAATSPLSELHVTASLGTETLKGTGGSDQFTFYLDSATAQSSLDSTDTISGGAGLDTLEISGSAPNHITTLTDADITHVTGIENLLLHGDTTLHWDLDFDSAFQAEGFSTVSFADVAGSSQLDAHQYTTDLTIQAGTGALTLLLGSGNDLVEFGYQSTLVKLDSGDKVDGGAGVDTLQFDNHSQMNDADFTNVSNVEVLTVHSGLDLTVGAHFNASGIATIDTSGSTTGDNINAAASTHSLTIIGGNAADAIAGGLGADHITGGAGGDYLVGGGGADTFIYHSVADSHQQLGGSLVAADLIVDFNAGDTIDLEALVGKVDGVTNLGAVPSFPTADIAGFYGSNTVAVEFDGSNTRLFVDANHDGNFNANHDLVVQVVGNHVAQLADTASYA